MESSLIGLGGALIGILLGHFLTRSSQHKQWLRDNRKQEYRELLSAISEAFLLVYKYGPYGKSDNYQLVQSMKHESFKVLHDRIFIAEELKSAGILGKWTNIINSMEPGQFDWSVEDQFTLLKAELVRMALNDPHEFDWFYRLKKIAEDGGFA